MSIPFSEVASQLQQKCEGGIGQAASALEQAFGEPWVLELGTAIELKSDTLPADWDGSGLVIVFQSGQNAGLALMAESSGLVPAWCQEPDESAQTKLRSLAEELGRAFFPTHNTNPACSIGRVKNLRNAMLQAAPAEGSALIPVSVRRGEQVATWWVAWPASKPDAVQLDERITSAKSASQAKPASPNAAAASSQTPRRPALRYHDVEEGIGLLPSYSRSLLRIRVPVTVTLAATKQSLQAILNIGSGSIIHFNKSCEDTLTLEVAGHKVAVGETVKVGDKFGLWITSMILPDERFWVINGRQPLVRAK